MIQITSFAKGSRHGHTPSVAFTKPSDQRHVFFIVVIVFVIFITVGLRAGRPTVFRGYPGLFSALPITKPLLAIPYNAAVPGRIGLCDETDQTCDEVDRKQETLHFPEHFSKALD